MNLTTVTIGIVAIAFGVYTAWARQAKPDQFWKLEPMKKLWGNTAGYVVHFIAYTVVPILVGIIFVLNGLQGGSVL